MNNLRVRSVSEISRSVLIGRINKQLAEDGEILRKLRESGSPSFGAFYADTNSIADRKEKLNLESIGRELGVLSSDEQVADS